MDMQIAFNAAVGVAGLVGGWLFRVLWDLQKGVRADLSELQKSLPDVYARRDDFKELVHTLFTKLDRIETKLDNKLDKP